MITPRLASVLAVFAASPLVLTGCETAHSGSAIRGSFVLDGDISEWRESAVATADDRFVYLRFAIEGDPTTLQSNSETTRIVIDTDNDPSTGYQFVGTPEIGTLGIDLEVHLSPNVDSLDPDSASWYRERATERDQPVPTLVGGVAVQRFEPDGTRRHASHADIDFALAPTYANPWFEARIGRLSSALIGSGLDAEGTAKAMVLIEDESRDIVGYSDPVEIALPSAATGLGLAPDTVPAQQAGSLRVLSFNVLRAKPMREPEPFAGLITALAPDVILFQEFNGLDADELADWLGENVGRLEGKPIIPAGPDEPMRPWYTVAEPEGGVAIASVHPITRPFDDPVSLVGPNDEDRTARAISALLETPFGDALVTSVHLKCCGSAGSREDEIRMLEAEAVRDAINDAAQQASSITGRWPSIRVVGGDINLVGSRPPVDVLGEGIDADGSALSTAEARVLGDRAYYTWSDPTSSFSPGRLDWILYSDSSLRVDRSFVLDLGRLTRESVERSGLRPSDTAASDHLPLVADLAPLR
ncbi:MAG: endonuclease/exonuclease/phosphatase family protein [Planctomycetota bacterium]